MFIIILVTSASLLLVAFFYQMHLLLFYMSCGAILWKSNHLYIGAFLIIYVCLYWGVNFSSLSAGIRINYKLLLCLHTAHYYYAFYQLTLSQFKTLHPTLPKLTILH